MSGGVAGKRTVDFREDVVLISLTFHAPGCRRKMRATDLDEDADSQMIHVSKDLVDSDEYRAVRRAQAQFKGWVMARALPCTIMRDGVFALPVRLLPEVDDAVAAHERELQDKLVPAFLEALPRKIEEARVRLGRHFDAADYPSAARLRGAFGLTHYYVTLGTPDKLRSVSDAVWQRERAKIEKMWEEAGATVRDALRAGFAELVARMVRRCSGTEDGKKRIIREAGVERLTEFLDLFDARNVTGDAELKALVAKAKAAMHWVDADRLRDDESVRARVAQSFQALQTAVQGWEALKPGRKIRMGEEGGK